RSLRDARAVHDVRRRNVVRAHPAALFRCSRSEGRGRGAWRAVLRGADMSSPPGGLRRDRGAGERGAAEGVLCGKALIAVVPGEPLARLRASSTRYGETRDPYSAAEPVCCGVWAPAFAGATKKCARLDREFTPPRLARTPMPSPPADGSSPPLPVRARWSRCRRARGR